MSEETALRILLVEDDPEDAEIFRRCAAESELYRIEVHHVGTSDEVLRHLSEQEYDLVFLDQHLGEAATGLDILKRVRAERMEPPIIVLTGKGNEQIAVEMMKSGAKDYLLKDTFNCEILERSLRYALEQHRSAVERKCAQEALRDSEEKFRTIFESIPCGVLVFDGDRRVRALNNTLERTLGVNRTEAVGKRGGEVLGCVHAFDSPEGCGYSDACESCQVRSAALEALAGMRVHRSKAQVQLLIEGKKRDRTLLVSASPIDYGGERLAVVMLEDVTELNRLRSRLQPAESFAGIVGRDPKMLELFDTIRELSRVNAPVLIQGQSGTGKELVALAIHSEGPRAERLFVPVNCSALPETLLESELFGYVKGAFTGALRDRKGRFELADGGTIFFDEVGDLSPTIQVKLLRVLQEGTFERVGSEESINVDVRVISATNKDLREEVDARRFREDLFYRLCVVPLNLPPLRQRREDIPLLVDHVLKNAVEEAGREEMALSQEALDAIMKYHWPGNVRELQNAIQYALVKSRGNVLELEHLPPTLHGGRAARRKPAKKRRRRKLSERAVRQALEQCNGNKTEAARVLHVGRATLYRFLHDAGLADEFRNA